MAFIYGDGCGEGGAEMVRHRGVFGLTPLRFFTTLTNSTKMHQFSLLMGQKTFWQGMNMGILSHSPLSGCALFWQFIVTQTMGIRFNCTSH